ncbi:MAG: AEC family transporter [Dehalococcoidia bacterium]
MPGCNAGAAWRWPPLNQLMLYLLGPALIIDSLLNAELAAGASVRVISAVVLITIATLAVATTVSKLLRQERTLESGFLLAAAFPNAANMALPVTLLAFGESGFTVAIIIFATHSILGWSVGMFVAARGSFSGFGPLLQTARSPVLWAIALALLLRATGITLPVTLSEPISMLASASIPVMLVILGFQLARGVELDRWPNLVAVLTVRLVISAGIAYGVTLLLGLEGITQQTIIAVSAMPTAVFTTILATEFKAEARFVTSAVISSTLLSLLTLTVLITVLQTFLG